MTQVKFYKLFTFAVITLAFLASCSGSNRLNMNTMSVSSDTTTTIASTAVNDSSYSGAYSFIGNVNRVFVDGVTVAYREFGSGAPLVMITAEDESMNNWTPNLLLTLSRHYKVLIFDNPGVGYSVMDQAENMTVNWLGKVTYDFLQAIGLYQTDLLGWGLGGQVALYIAENYPKEVTKLILLGTSAGGPKSVLGAPLVTVGLTNVNSTNYFINSLLFSTAASFANYYSQVQSLGQEIVNSQVIGEQAQAELSFNQDAEVYEKLGSIQSPALIICGSRDDVFPSDNSDELAAALTYTTKVIVSGDGNAVLFEDEDAVVKLIETFTN
jgi:pimeloyl-ACP methyl ester carboxylesterase